MICFSLLVMIATIFLSGVATQKVLKIPFSFTNAMMVGFLSLLAVFQVIAYPMMRLNTSFSLLFWVYSCILLLIALFSLATILRREPLAMICEHVQELWNSVRGELPLVLLALGMVFAAFLISYCFSYTSSDDSYYLPRVMEILAHNQLGISQGFSWTGLVETSFPDNVDASTLECWKAYWSYLFDIHPTVFCRTTLTCIVHFVSWCSLYQAFQSIANHENSIITGCVFLIVYLFFVLLDNQQGDTLPFWTIRYPVQGKSILLSIIYPGILYGCARIVELGKNPIPWNRWCMLSIVLTAGIAVTIIGVFWPFICCVSMGLPYLLIARRKDIPKLILPLILTSLPVVIYAGLAYFLVATEQTRYLALDAPDWYHSLQYGVNIDRLVIVPFCLAFIGLRGSRTAKYILVGGSVALFVGCLNPLFLPIVSKYLTTGTVYFRLFWMVPIYVSIAYTAAEIIGARSANVRKIIAGSILVIFLSGVGIGLLKTSPKDLVPSAAYELNLVTNADRRENSYGLVDSWYTLAKTLVDNKSPEEHVRVMWISDQDCLLRQYSIQIELVGACRGEQWKYADQPLDDCDIPPRDIYDSFVRDNKNDFDDPDWAHTQLVLSGIDFLCVNDFSEFAQRSTIPSGFEFISTFDNVSVYRVIR